MLRSAFNLRPNRVFPYAKPALLGRVLGCGSQHAMRGVVSEHKIAEFKPKTENRAKLRGVFIEYYEANYTQTIPSRFFKEIVTSVDENKDGIVEYEDLKSLLERIGYGDRFTDEELKGCLTEFGANDLTISTDEMLDVLLHPEKDPAA